ncbi:MAG: hypothetical protein MJ219_01990 [Mycoplasmoidaceae bacterium]|nr:hypothetical protein [Mycoplasmoidaceae bacterium]
MAIDRQEASLKERLLEKMNKQVAELQYKIACAQERHAKKQLKKEFKALKKERADVIRQVRAIRKYNQADLGSRIKTIANNGMKIAEAKSTKKVKELEGK